MLICAIFLHHKRITINESYELLSGKWILLLVEMTETKFIQIHIQEQWDGDTIHFNTETDHT